MTGLRRALAPITATWLCCQVASVALVPVALWIAAADPHGIECTCGHGLGAMCPMHHKPAEDPPPCGMKSADAGAVVLTTLIGTAGPVAEPARSIQPPIPSIYLRTPDIHLAADRPVPPDPPPPRA